MIAALCLDLMGVVLRDPYAEALRAATGMDMRTAHRLTDPDAWPDFEMARIDEATFVRRFYADPAAGHRFDLDAFHRARRAGYRFMPGIPQLLDDLHGLLPRYVASNYPVWVEELRVAFALDERFEGVVSSHHLGVRKPDPVFFARLLEHVGQPAPACLFVDDRPVNCEAARAAGMQVMVFDGTEGVRARLRAEGVGV